MIFKTYEIGKRNEGYNSFGQPVNDFVFDKTADIFICLKTQSNTLDPRFSQQTHTGLTSDKTIQEDMLIEDGDKQYKVMLVNPQRRLAILYLMELK